MDRLSDHISMERNLTTLYNYFVQTPVTTKENRILSPCTGYMVAYTDKEYFKAKWFNVNPHDKNSHQR